MLEKYCLVEEWARSTLTHHFSSRTIYNKIYKHNLYILRLIFSEKDEFIFGILVSYSHIWNMGV